MSKTVRIVSRFDSYTGIGYHGWSFIKALTAVENRLKIEAVVTDPQISKKDFALLHDSKVIAKYSHQVTGKSDIAIYCDVLSQSDVRLYNLGDINALYFAWDSTLIPKNFVRIIEDSFDILVVPTQFVRDALISSGVQVDILILPLVISKPEILSSTPKKRFTFGFIGSYENRKNVEILIEAFSKTLDKLADLRIHLTYSHKTEEALQSLIEKYRNSNICISIGKLDRNSFLAVLDSIDCFISLSMGEGYSLIPREYMYLGRPVILSYSSGHKSIPKMDGLWFIPADVPYPAHYPQIDNKDYGVFHGSYIEDILLALYEIWPKVKNWKNYPKLSIYADSLSADSLSENYHALVDPKRIIVSTFTSHISSDRCLTLKSKSLVEKKYKPLVLNKVKPFAKCAVDDRIALPVNKHVVLANDGGFFSVFNRYVSILTNELEEDPQSLIIPDWRVSSIVEQLGHSNFSSFCYGNEADGNIFLRLFEPPFDIPLSSYEDSSFLRNDAYLRTDYDETKEPHLTYIHAYKLYKRKDFQNWRDLYHQYFSRYIFLRKDLQQSIDTFIEHNFDGYFVISAHIRHPSHSIEQPGGRLPTVEVFKEIIDQQISIVSKSQEKLVRLFIATDQYSVIEYFRQFYNDIMITTHATRATAEHDLAFNRANRSEEQIQGFQIQHIMASDSSKWSVKMADEVIIDTWLLASSELFIHITSNIATAVSFINPNIRMVYCE